MVAYNNKTVGINDDINQILKVFYGKAAPDYKNLIRHSIPAHALKYFVETLNVFGIKILIDKKTKIHPIIIVWKNNAEYNGQTIDSCQLTYVVSGKVKTIDIDYHTKPGFLKFKDKKVKGSELSVIEFVGYYNTLK